MTTGHNREMGVRDGRVDRARRRCNESVRRVAGEVRRARVAAGLSQQHVGEWVGASHSRVGRFERGELGHPDVAFISDCCAIVGLELSLRAYPAGDAIRDVAHARLLARVRNLLHPGLRWHTEVPFPAGGDLRSWDALTGASNWRIGVEAETVVDDTQALDRKLAMKRRDGLVDHLILLVADTRRNRRALAAAPAAFADLPLRSRAILRALRHGENPGASRIVVL
ncbi:MAG TPA: helix-turn-helix transcriptional regulator [Candidatus Limnocylindrales bacterium]